jgi:heme exporter protein B
MRHLLAIASKDLKSELRTKETLNASISFSVTVLLLFSFAFEPSADQMRELGGGLLWMVFLFAGTLIVNRAFARELPNDCLDILLVSPVSATSLFLGKCLANFVIMLVVEAAAIPVFLLFNNLTLLRPWDFVLTALLASWAITVIGVAFGALTVNLRLRELMLPVMLYPMVIPPLLAAFDLTGRALSGEPPEMLWLRVLVGFDVIFTCLSILVMDQILVN